MLYIDDRAGSRDLVEYDPIRTTGELTRLDSGDAMICGNGPDGPLLIGIEVKSIWDLISSMTNGRLQGTQIPAMLQTYDLNWLVWYGGVKSGSNGQLLIRKGIGWRSFRLGRSRPVPYGYLHSFLIELTTLGVRVTHVYDIEEAAAWIGTMYRWWTKEWAEHKGMRTLDRSRQVSLMPGMSEEIRTRTAIAAQLPGLGFEKALAAASHFPTVTAMVTATEAQWREVPGVGKVLAKAIVAALR